MGVVLVPELVSTGNVKPTTAAGGVKLDVDAANAALLDALATGLLPLIIGPVVTNAQGSYVRLENGLQVCWVTPTGTSFGTTTQTVAPWWNTSLETFTFPAPFIAIPAVTPAGAASSGFGLGIAVRNITATSVELCGFGVNNQQTWKFGYVAIGRWK